jgi:ribosomal-protein-alanine N-acetyltransferase
MLNLNFTAFPKLVTERLILRQLEAEDANEIFALRSSDEKPLS